MDRDPQAWVSQGGGMLTAIVSILIFLLSGMVWMIVFVASGGNPKPVSGFFTGILVSLALTAGALWRSPMLQAYLFGNTLAFAMVCLAIYLAIGGVFSLLVYIANNVAERGRNAFVLMLAIDTVAVIIAAYLRITR